MTAHNVIESNAFNSASFVTGGVDPRTGQYTVSVSLPDVTGNALCGPSLPISLGFSPINHKNSGFGTGWTLALSQYTPLMETSGILSLSTGETLKVDGIGNAPRISEQKLDTFKFFVESRTRFRIEHKSGQTEILELQGGQIALPVRIYSPLGHYLDLSYRSGGGYQILHEVRQADGKLLLRLHPGNGTLDIRYMAGHDSTELSNYLLQLDGNELRHLTLPSDEGPRWRFDYQTVYGLTCMKEVRSPYGTQEVIEHLGPGHSFPGASRMPMPRVSRHIIEPGCDQPRIESRYEYSDHNFLGFGAPDLQFPDDGLDALYQVNGSYEYHSIQTRWHDEQPGRSVKCVYNRYHLMTERTIRNGNTLLIQATEYHIDDTLAFDLQAPQCQLPRKVTTRWALANDPTRLRDRVETSLFDTFGNLVEKIGDSGVRETWTYYSALGEDGCPPDPFGFTRQVKEHRLFPAPVASPAKVVAHPHGYQKLRPTRRPPPRYNDEPVLISRYRYTTHPPLADGPLPMLVLAEQVNSQLLSGTEQALLSTRYRYIDEPENSLRHGKPDEIVEARLGHLTTTTFKYDLTARPGAVAFCQQVTSGLDEAKSEITHYLELYTGSKLETRSADGQVIAYAYDLLRRVTSETVMPGDQNYAATRRYRYRLGSNAGQFAQLWEVDAKGVETRTESDGMGRVIRRLRQIADGSADAQAFRLQYSARYGHDNDLLEETHYDWLDDGLRELKQTYEYDDWDQVCRTVDAAGIGSNSLGDPLSLTLTEWQDGMAKTVTRLNRFDKPEQVEVYALDGRRLGLQRSFYDGHGQLRLAVGSGGERSEYAYDSFGRITRSLLPDGTRLDTAYAEHSTSALVTQLQVTPGNRVWPTTVAGTQVFDGLERLTTSTTGRRTQRLRYEGSRTLPAERITPSQQSIHYDYNLALGDEPIAIRAEQNCTFEYDPVTAQLNKAESPEGTLDYQYDSLGQLTLERSVIAGQVRETRYSTSPAGRPIAREGFGGLNSAYTYDDRGRPLQVVEGQLQATFEYNSQGQRERTTTHDVATGNTMVTEVEYDELGRETLRVQRMTRTQEHRTTLAWATDGQLQQRELQVGGQLALREQFTYDLRGRLVRHLCTGPDLPTDRYGNAIREQLFYFDSLDNLLYCASYFADGSEDIAQHFYADDDACQLRSVQHSHPDYPAEVLLSYDADGNLLADADGRGLEYDRQGRLLAVESPRGTPLTQYRYNAHDQLQGVTQGTGEETLRFYEGHQLRNTVQGNRHSSFVYDGATPLGQQQAGDIDRTLLTLCNGNHSVLAEVRGNSAAKRTQYTSHGEPSEPLESQLGYNGEVREGETGWYLLGSGYRAYNPQLRCFHSPDSASPFGAGGINPYAYCLGNPIRFRDPTGHAAQPGLAERRRKAALKKASWENFGFTMLIGTVAVVGLSALMGGVSVGMLMFNMGETLGEALYTQWVIENDKDRSWLEVIAVAQISEMILTIGISISKMTKRTAAETANSTKVWESLDLKKVEYLENITPPRRHSAPGVMGWDQPNPIEAPLEVRKLKVPVPAKTPTPSPNPPAWMATDTIQKPLFSKPMKNEAAIVQVLDSLHVKQTTLNQLPPVIPDEGEFLKFIRERKEIKNNNINSIGEAARKIRQKS